MKCFRNKSSCSSRARSSGIKKHAAFQERFGQRIAPEQLIVRKNQPAGDRLEPGGAFEDFIPLGLSQSGRLGVTGKVERIDTRKTPRLVLSIRETEAIRTSPRRRAVDPGTNREARRRARRKVRKESPARNVPAAIRVPLLHQEQLSG